MREPHDKRAKAPVDEDTETAASHEVRVYAPIKGQGSVNVILQRIEAILLFELRVGICMLSQVLKERAQASRAGSSVGENTPCPSIVTDESPGEGYTVMKQRLG